jgi:outer membrane protein assembly factor BamB
MAIRNLDQERSAMSFNDLVFVGFNKQVAALDRNTGDIVWEWRAPKPWGTGYVTMLLDGDRLVVSVNGYIYCLDPATGEQIWNNEMAGFGTGVTSLVSVRGQTPSEIGVVAAHHTAQQAAAAAAAGS